MIVNYCLNVMCQTPYAGYLTYQRSFTNSPLKKKRRLDATEQRQQQQTPTNVSSNDNNNDDDDCTSLSTNLSSSSEVILIGTATTTNDDGLNAAERNGAVSLVTPRLRGHGPSYSNGSLSFLCPMSSSSSSSSSSSTSTIVLKSESNAIDDDDDDDETNPVRKQLIAGNCLLLTYFAEDIDTNIDTHFSRALQESQQQRHQLMRNGFSSDGSQSQLGLLQSSCCRQYRPKDELSALSQCINFPSSTSSFWKSASYRSPAAAGWSSMMVPPPPTNSPPTIDLQRTAAAFSVSSNPDAAACAYHHLNTHFPSVTLPCTSGLGSLHPGAQDPWGASYPPQSAYRRYRRSIHEFTSATTDAAISSGGGHLGPSEMGRYKSFLAPSTAAEHGRLNCIAAAMGHHDDDLKPGDVWRTRCYGYGDMSPSQSHLSAGFSLPGGIEVAAANNVQQTSSIKDVYWF